MPVFQAQQQNHVFSNITRRERTADFPQELLTGAIFMSPSKRHRLFLPT